VIDAARYSFNIGCIGLLTTLEEELEHLGEIGSQDVRIDIDDSCLSNVLDLLSYYGANVQCIEKIENRYIIDYVSGSTNTSPDRAENTRLRSKIKVVKRKNRKDDQGVGALS